MKIQIIGTACPNCKIFETYVKESIQELQLEAELSIVDLDCEKKDHKAIDPPALIINGKLILNGLPPKKEDIKNQLKNYS